MRLSRDLQRIYEGHSIRNFADSATRSRGLKPTFLRCILRCSVVFCLSLTAQKATELFIPIGKSPGLSAQGKTIQGTISKVEGNKITIGEKSIEVSDKTKIFLDRSEVKKTSTIGTRADIVAGVFVESFSDEWIKIRSK